MYLLQEMVFTALYVHGSVTLIRCRLSWTYKICLISMGNDYDEKQAP